MPQHEDIHERKGRSVASPITIGLRMMSIKICEKVQESKTTTCSEVAEELVGLIKNEQETQQGSGKKCDEKNVRRRTYDALNVLEAVKVIAKDGKDITWKGTTNGAHLEVSRMKAERRSLKKRIVEKEEALRGQLGQQIAYRNLVLFNRERISNAAHKRDTRVLVAPFMVFNTETHAAINCDASPEMSNIMVDVNAPFAVHDEHSILRQMGLHQTTLVDLNKLVTGDMLDYCQKHNLLDGLVARKRDHDANEDGRPSAPLASNTRSTQKQQPSSIENTPAKRKKNVKIEEE